MQDDPVQKTINAGDMENLAMMVLNGEGKALIGKKSKQPDIQSFIDNVPTYMVSRVFPWVELENSLIDVD